MTAKGGRHGAVEVTAWNARHKTPSPAAPRSVRPRCGAVLDAVSSVALHLAGRSPRPEGSRGVRDGADLRRQIGDHRGAVYLQMGDRCAGRPWHRADRGQQLAGLGDGGAGGDDARLWRHPHPDGGAHPMARRHFCQGGNERGAAARAAHLRAHAPFVTALPSRAQDRRPDAHPRTRAQRHRDHRAHGAAAACCRPSSNWL